MRTNYTFKKIRVAQVHSLSFSNYAPNSDVHTRTNKRTNLSMLGDFLSFVYQISLIVICLRFPQN